MLSPTSAGSFTLAPSEAAQQALQTELNKPLMEALRESAEQDIFPAFKIVEMKPKTDEQPEET